VDAKTDELRAAHDVLAELYADRLAGALDRMPAEQAVLGLFCDLTLAAGLGATVGISAAGRGGSRPAWPEGACPPGGSTCPPG
jgi:hypothetical protein